MYMHVRQETWSHLIGLAIGNDCVLQFPMMAKIDVNGGKADPFYSFLKKKQGGIIVSDIKW